MRLLKGLPGVALHAAAFREGLADRLQRPHPGVVLLLRQLVFERAGAAGPQRVKGADQAIHGFQGA